MKTIGITMLMVLMLALSSSAQVSFKDVPDNFWAKDAVYDLVKRGITDGFPDGTFRGKETLTRYQTAVFLHKMANSIEKKIVSKAQIQKMIDNSGGSSRAAGGSNVSGVTYFAYKKNVQNSSTINNFDIERVYITIKNKLSPKTSSRVTFDVSRAGGTANLYSYLKYAYVDLKDIGVQNVNARIGLQPTYWAAFVDGILGIRYVTKNLVDLEGVLTSADFGVGTNGQLNVAGLPAVNFVVTALNGSGYKSTETNSGKDIGLRLNSEVYPGVVLALGGQIKDVDSSSSGNKLANVLVAYKAEAYKGYLEYLYGQGASGYSLGGICSLGLLDRNLFAYELFGRLDNYDPNRSTANDAKDRVILGASYALNKSVKFAADYVSTRYGSAASSNAGQTVAVAELRAQVKF